MNATTLRNDLASTRMALQKMRKERDLAQAKLAQVYEEYNTSKRAWKRELVNVRSAHSPALQVYLTLLMRLHATVDEVIVNRRCIFRTDAQHLITPRIENELLALVVGQMRFVPLLHGEQRRTLWHSDAHTYFLTEGRGGKVHTVIRDADGDDGPPFQGISVDVNLLLEDIGSIDISEAVQNVSCDLFCSLSAAFCKIDSSLSADLCKSKLMIKPAALQLWVQIARHRTEFTTARMVAHGTSKETADRIAEDPFGFSLMHAAKNGELKGRGVYVTLYNSIAAGYNRDNPSGTVLLCLILTGDTLESSVVGNSLTAYSFLGAGIDAACVHETCLILVLGIVVPEDAMVEIS